MSGDDDDDTSWAEREFEGVSHDYERIPIPDTKKSSRFTAAERRAEIYRLIRESGHPASLSLSQRELGNRYGVTQQTISRDIEELRTYRTKLVGDTAIAHTEFVAERAVRGELEEGNYARALHAQIRYNEFLFDIGRLKREPDEISFQGDPGDAYLAMLKQQNERERERGEEPLHAESSYDDGPDAESSAGSESNADVKADTDSDSDSDAPSDMYSDADSHDTDSSGSEFGDPFAGERDI